jgi:hypothetical protein
MKIYLASKSARRGCNIDKTDRINRAVIGAALFIAALIGMGKIFFMLVGLILVIEGVIGWCYIPYLVNKIKGN